MTNDTYFPTSSKPFAIFDPDTQSLKMYEDTLASDSTPFSQALPQSGMMRNGVLFELPKLAHHTKEPGFTSLPTPLTTDGTKGTISQGTKERIKVGQVGLTNVAYDIAKDNGLKLPEPKLLPTPVARDYKDGQAEHKRNGIVQTDTVSRAIFNSGEVKLFNTPTTMDAKATNNPELVKRFIGQGKQTCLTYDVAINWGKYEAAITRWEKVTGRKAPSPTVPDGRNDSHRLSSAFSEWLMGLPKGWITDVGLSRNQELKACGNGVVPQAAKEALARLI